MRRVAAPIMQIAPRRARTTIQLILEFICAFAQHYSLMAKRRAGSPLIAVWVKRMEILLRFMRLE